MLLLIIMLFLLILYLGLASVGHRFFVHQFYVSKLLKLFEHSHERLSNKKTDKWIQKKISSSSSLSSLSDKSNLSFDSDYNTDSAFNSDEIDSDQDEVPEIFRSNHSMSLKLSETRRELNLATAMEFAQLGIQAIVDDEVTKRFASAELKTWNLLTRTDKINDYKSFRLICIWFGGIMFRYTFLFPIRVFILFIGVLWLILVTAMIGMLPESQWKKDIYYHMSIMCFRILSRSFSFIITYHDQENKAKPGGVCVANHTSPIDIVALHCDNSYALTGQRHNGFFGLLQRALARAENHIWFDRTEIKDRQAVAKRLRDHCETGNNLPILIFPEGTCVNNSAVMMFKKGCFEIGAPIYPVAIKFDARFGDPFWNSSKYGALHYLFMMMTSWAIVCDVWYLPAMHREEGETAIQFANRVKSKIASTGGLVDMEWDGQLKRAPVKPEMVQLQQWKFCQSLTFYNNSNQNNNSNIINQHDNANTNSNNNSQQYDNNNIIINNHHHHHIENNNNLVVSTKDQNDNFIIYPRHVDNNNHHLQSL